MKHKITQLFHLFIRQYFSYFRMPKSLEVMQHSFRLRKKQCFMPLYLSTDLNLQQRNELFCSSKTKM